MVARIQSVESSKTQQGKTTAAQTLELASARQWKCLGHKNLRIECSRSGILNSFLSTDPGPGQGCQADRLLQEHTSRSLWWQVPCARFITDLTNRSPGFFICWITTFSVFRRFLLLGGRPQKILQNQPGNTRTPRGPTSTRPAFALFRAARTLRHHSPTLLSSSRLPAPSVQCHRRPVVATLQSLLLFLQRGRGHDAALPIKKLHEKPCNPEASHSA